MVIKLKKLFPLCLILLVLLLTAGPVGAYGTWEPEPPTVADVDLDRINAAIERLEAAVTLADQNRSAHPDFLTDLWDILAQFKDARDFVNQQLGLPQETLPTVGEPQYWNFTGELTNANPSARFTLQMDSPGDLMVTATRSSDLGWKTIVLYDRDGETEVYRNSARVEGEHHIPRLRAGTYHLELVKDGRQFYYGPFTADVSSRPVSVPNVSGSNSSYTQAYLLPLDTTISGHLAFNGQLQEPQMESWYRFTLPRDGDMVLTYSRSGLELEGEPVVRPNDGILGLQGVYLYGSDGQQVLATIPVAHSEGRYQIDDLSAGTYYIRIAADQRWQLYWGTYTLRIEAIPY